MGVVHAAYDPQLDRTVAIKLVLPGADTPARSEESRARLMREAMALAKLNHPNVVAVHDVGTMDGRVWLAMELVDGETLRDWSRAESRRWSEVVDVMQQAGRGLAAAHAAGLLHRDFKPDNVMVGHDGRVRVMDFGLVRADESPESEAMTLDPASSVASAAPNLVTRAGALMGTPSYMAPEQFGGMAATERTDQFSFCVTLWELLFGERPFKGDSLMSLAAAVLEGARRPTTTRAVPAWLRRTCERGLSRDPTQRFESMDALLEALGAARRRTTVRRVASVGAVLAVAGLGLLGVRNVQRAEQRRACEAAGRVITASWNDELREDVREAMLGTEVSFAAATVLRLLPSLDAYAERWADARTEVCLDARVHGTRSEESLTRAQWCLEERATELGALVEEFSRADVGVEVARRAVTAVMKLPAVEPCRDARRLERQGTPPSDRWDEAREITDLLSRAHAQSLAGEHERGAQTARTALDRAVALDWPPAIARARALMGFVFERAGEYPVASEVLEEAYFLAADSDALEVAARAATRLAFVVGVARAQPEDGLLWARLAEVEFARHGTTVEDLSYARLLRYQGLIHREMSHNEDALALLERSMSIQEQILGSDHIDLAIVLSDLASVHRQAARFDRATSLNERAIVLQESVLGPDHPDVAGSLITLANLYFSKGEYLPARESYERALAIQRRAYGPEHPSLAGTINNLAETERLSGNLERARTLHEDALALFEKAHGRNDPRVAQSLNNLALIEERTNSRDEAFALHQEALAIRERTLGPEHPRVAFSLIGMADLLVGRRDLESAAQALPLLERARDIHTRALGPEHPHVAFSLTALAEVALTQGRLDDALSLARRSVEIREAHDVPPRHRAHSRFVVARILRRRGAHDEAGTIAEQIAAELREIDPKAPLIETIERWQIEDDDAAVEPPPTTPPSR